MKYRKYLIHIINKGDNEAAGLLEYRLPKQGLNLGKYREIRKAVKLLFPKVEIKIVSREMARKPKARIL